MQSLVTDIITTDSAVANTEKRLSICLGSNGFSFSVATLNDVLLTVGEVGLGQYSSATSLARVVAETVLNGEAALGYKQMSLILPSMHFAWIPEHLYDPSRDRQYLNVVASIPDAAGVSRIYSPALKSYIVFAVPSDIVMAFKIALPGIDIHCQHSVLADSSTLSSSVGHPAILLHVRSGMADIEAYYNGHLLLSATYPSSDREEVLYHTLNVMKQLHLETPDIQLSICGQVDRDFYLHLCHFFPNVDLFTGKQYSFINPDFQTLHTYKYALVLSK